MGTLRFEALAGSSPDTWMRSRHFGEFGLHQIGPGFLKIHTGYCCRASNPEGVILAASSCPASIEGGRRNGAPEQRRVSLLSVP